MGCAESKLDDLKAVALCRARSQCLADAIRHRQFFANAQATYVYSLRTVAVSLDRFFHIPQTDLSFCSSSSSSPILTLPQSVPRKNGSGGGYGGGFEFDTSFPSFNNSAGHIRFYDDDEDDEDDYGVVISRANRFDYARREGPPSSTAVTYEQRPSASDVLPIHVGVNDGYGNKSHLRRQSPASSFHYTGGGGGGGGGAGGGAGGGGSGGGGGGCSYQNTSNRYNFDYCHHNPTAYGANGGGAYFESTSAMYSPSPSFSNRFRPPPSPPKPSSSAWDFLNPFDSYPAYSRIYTPSWSSKEVRDMEGIPDLEPVDDHVVVKEMYGDRNFKLPSNATSDSPAMWSFSGRQKEITVENEEERDTVGVVEEVEEKTHQIVSGTRSVSDTMHEIRILFDRASMSGKEVSKILGSGKFTRNTEVPSKPFSMNSDDHSLCSSSGYFDLNKPPTTRNHSSTLQKLHVWEKKLHEEVRAEEKLRLLHEKKCKLLKRLAEHGGIGNESDTDKIESTRALIGKLSTKIRIAIKFIDSISNKLNRLRDEEFWPQIIDLIRGMSEMWRTMSECHRRQWQAISEAKNMDVIVSENTGRLNDWHMNATVELLLELLDLVAKFSNWIETQKNYSKSLNGWLRKCLHCDEEEAPQSPLPPPVFAACKYWSELNQGLSEREVIDAIQGFATSVLQVWRQHYYERRQIVADEDKEMTRMVKGLEKRDRMIQKAVNAVNKRFFSSNESDDRFFPSSSLYAYDVLRLSHVSEPNNLKLGLKRVCQAMERFTVRSLKAYEKLCVLCDAGGGGSERVAKKLNL